MKCRSNCSGRGVFGFYAPKGLRPLAQGWRTRLPWVRQNRYLTPTGLRRMLDVMQKIEKIK
jgi:hypothetical protein